MRAWVSKVHRVSSIPAAHQKPTMRASHLNGDARAAVAQSGHLGTAEPMGEQDAGVAGGGVVIREGKQTVEILLPHALIHLCMQGKKVKGFMWIIGLCL